MRDYSRQFLELIAGDGEKRVEEILAGSSSGGTFEFWEKKRSFIASAISHPGTILDIGCANGFFLRCLEEWSEYNLVTYGIDINEDFILQARQLFPEKKKNFTHLSCDDIESLGEVNLPETYDFVYRSIWRKQDFDSDLERTIDDLLNLVKPSGKLIVGMYGGNSHPLGSDLQIREKKNIQRLLEQITATRHSWSPILMADSGTSNGIRWIDK